MFKVIVVDDEKMIRKGIITMLNRGFGDEIQCFEASDGKTALKVIQDIKPQIVLTDICMPKMNGLELIHALQEGNHDITVIIISGYEDFGFAIQAMSLGIRDYLMKPIRREKLIALLQKHRRHIEERNLQVEQERKRIANEEKATLALRDKVLLTLLKADNQHEVKLQCVQSLESMNVNVEGMFFSCAVLAYKNSQENKDYMQALVCQVLEDLVGEYPTSGFLTHVPYGSEKRACIFMGNTRRKIVDNQKSILKKAVERIVKGGRGRVYVGIGTVIYSVENLSISVQQAFYASMFKLFDHSNGLHFYEEKAGQTEDEIELKTVEIASHFRYSQVMDIFYFHRKYAGKILREKRMKVLHDLKREYEEVHKLVRQRAVGQNPRVSLKAFDSCWSMEEVYHEMKQGLEELNVYKKQKSGNQDLFEKILLYIDENIKSDIDLQVVASRFGITPSYVSSLFIKKMGQGFNEYLNQNRMEIAKKMLQGTMMSIKEISQLSGYRSPKYFAVAFKKATGMTPTEYRAN